LIGLVLHFRLRRHRTGTFKLPMPPGGTKTFLDTQIVSYGFKGDTSVPVRGCAISSITANEFLLVQSDKPAQANYYVRWARSPRHPSAHDLVHAAGNVKVFNSPIRTRPYRKLVTDSLHITFGGQFPDIIEYNNLSLSSAINAGNLHAYTSSVRFLGKEVSKALVRKFKFLVETQTLCVPVTRTEVELGFTILDRFLSEYSLKQDFRNSWNDVLILATAISHCGTLITEDSLLNRFAKTMFEAKSAKRGSLVSLSFPPRRGDDKIHKQESKGYINRSWQVHEHRPKH
jgi:predicted nucleic acid-binding protein